MSLEKLIFDRGKQILESAKNNVPRKGSTDYFNNMIFDMCMSDERLKKQLFRFIDVFPRLKTPESIAKHFKEYILDEKVDLGFLGIGGKAISLAHIISPHIISPIITRLVETMAKSFIAGETIDETVGEIKKIISKNMSFTLDILGEKTTSEQDAENYLNSYLDGLDCLGINLKSKQGNPLIDFSIKLSSLYSRFDPLDPKGTSEAVRQRLRPLYRKSRALNAVINIDVEDYYTRDITYTIFKELLMEEEFRDFDNTGIVVQAYLKNSGDVLKDLISWTRKNSRSITVRLVKGAYWDHEIMVAAKNNWEIPVFEEKWQTDRNYELLTRILLENSEYTHAAIATHNIRSIANALVLKDQIGVKPEHFEIQMLYGTANEIKMALINDNIPLRIYITSGLFIPGMGYFGRRLSENSANESFLRAFKPDADPVVLLDNPSELHDAFNDSTPEKNMLEKFSGILHKPTSGSISPESYKEFANAPSVNFSKGANRQAMQDAVERLHSGSLYYGLKIGEDWIDTKEYIESRDPSDISRVIGSVSRGDEEHINKAVKTANEAFKKWQYCRVEDRASYLYNVALQMKERMFDLSALIVYEAGKTWEEACADVNEALDFLNFYANEMIALGKSRLTQDIPGEENMTGYIPKGTVAVISPWNFPLAILTGMTSAAIITGNTVVMKPASDTVLIAGELMKMFENAGLPAGVLNYVPCSGHDVGKILVESPGIDMVAFTGSRNVGLEIYKKISEVRNGQASVKTAVLEMGGKNGIIIDESADIEQAMPEILYSAFGYQGQKCSACSRLIVLDSVYDEVREKLVESAKSLQTGDAKLPGTDVGPVINKKSYDKITSFIAEAKNREGHILLEGECSETPGYFISPSIIEANPDDIITQKEIFGPVLALMKASNIDESIEILNSTDYALTAGIYTRTPSHIKKFKKHAKAGNRYINRAITGAIVQRQPFGGFKMSGAGSKAGERNYLLNFMYQITDSENTARSSYIAGIERFVKNR